MGIDDTRNISGDFNKTVEDIRNRQEISVDFIEKMGVAGYDMNEIMDTLAVAFTWNRQVLDSENKVPDTLDAYERLREMGLDHENSLSASIMGDDPERYRDQSGSTPAITGPKSFDI